jgi:hypothetical protein
VEEIGLGGLPSLAAPERLGEGRCTGGGILGVLLIILEIEHALVFERELLCVVMLIVIIDLWGW